MPDNPETRTIEDAHAAFEKARNTPPAERSRWLHSIADRMDIHSTDLVSLAESETNLSTARLTGELVRTTFQLRLLGEEIQRGAHFQATIDHADSAWPMGARPDIRRMNVPRGVIGVFGASNFPFAFSVMGGDSASALAAGGSVVHKIHSAHPLLGRATSSIVVDALRAAGAPDGLFATIEGRAAGELLVDHPLTQAIGFTGSTAGGRTLFNRAAGRPNPIPFYGELGSINPVFVTPLAWDKRRDEILTQYVASFTNGMGQFCTKPGVLLIPRAEESYLAHLVGELLGTVQLSELLTPPLRQSFMDELDLELHEPGVRIVHSEQRGTFPSVTVLAADADTVIANPAIIRREMFGPASIIIFYDNATQFIELAGAFDGQLTATIIASDDDPSTPELVEVLAPRVGRLLWNGWPTGVTVSYAQNHGGPYPASTSSETSVGTAAIGRFMRPLAFQSFPATALPPALQDDNPWQIVRRVNGEFIAAPA